MVLVDMARVEPEFIREWHLYVPSDVRLGLPTFHVSRRPPLRFSAVYNYDDDHQLFRQRFLGPEGAPIGLYQGLCWVSLGIRGFLGAAAGHTLVQNASDSWRPCSLPYISELGCRS